MAVNHDSEYWSLVYQVMQYAIDEVPRLELKIGDELLGVLTEEEFLRELYVCQGDQEAQLREQLLLSSPLMLIIGARGCGKTSSICYVTKNVEGGTDHRRVLLLDAKSLAVQQIFDDASPETFRRKVSWTVRTRIRQILTRGDVDSEREILAWLLAGSPDRPEDFDDSVLATLHGLSVRIRTIARAEQGDRETRRQNILSWLRTNPEEFTKLQTEADELIKPAHVLLAAAQLARLKAVTIVYDNVDRIPLNHQALFRTIVTDTQHGLSGFCSSAIAIRQETTLGNVQPNEGGGHILVFAPGESYPTLLMPDSTSSHVEAIFRKRFEYAERVYYERTVVDAADGAEHRERREMAHAGVVGQLLEDKFYELANDNLRVMLGIYLAFMRFLIDEQVLDRLPRKNGETDPKRGGHLQTLFYVWLGAYGDRHCVPMYNVLEFGKIGPGARFNDIVSTRHYLMTCIWNLTHEGARWEPPTGYTDFRHVFERLATVGFTLGQVKQALQVLSAIPGAEPKMIEFRNDVYYIDKLTEHSNDKLKLTRMGGAIVSETSHKFGYVWSLAALRAKPDRKNGASYFDLKREERLAIFIAYLREMAQVHIQVLSLARDCLVADYSEQWLLIYLTYFGVDSTLQLERILQSGLDFVRHHGDEWAQVASLLGTYKRLVAQLEAGDSLDELDTDSLWAE